MFKDFIFAEKLRRINNTHDQPKVQKFSNPMLVINENNELVVRQEVST
jgi:hypothetical protein